MNTKADQRIDEVYHAPSREVLAKTYDDWASSYDADMQTTGYVHPAVMVGLVSRYVPEKQAAILDAGVGTGSLGQLLNILGYSNLSGVDMSDGMLARARARNVYADLQYGILGEVLNFKTSSMDCIVSTGTFTSGHAPASAFDELVRITKPAAYLIFTVGTVVWQQAGFAAKLAAQVGTGLIREVETTPVYHPMPLSPTESGFTTRAHVYQRA